MTTQFEREMQEQPDCLARVLAEDRGSVETIAEAVRLFAPAFVVTAARGSSDNAARYAKYLFGGHNRLVVSLGAPSLITLYDSPPALARALIIGISQSGESPDIVALLAEGRRQGALTVAITNHPGSPLGQAAAHVIELHLGAELSVAATKSYTGQLMALAMLSAAIEGDVMRWRDLAGVSRAARETLFALTRELPPGTVTPLAAANRMMVVGRGFNFATAFEIALKIKETAYVMAEPYATPDLFHGPLAMIEPGFPAIVIAARGPTWDSVSATLDALATRGAHVLAISDDAALMARADVQARLPFGAGVPEWLSPIVAVMPGQLLALRLAETRGLDVDRPRGLDKVTRTR